MMLMLLSLRTVYSAGEAAPFRCPARRLSSRLRHFCRGAASCGARRRHNRSLWLAHTRLQVAAATKDDL